MYIPKHFREEDQAKICAFIRANNFGILLSSREEKMQGTHLPFLLDEYDGRIRLTTHLAAANGQLKDLEARPECLVIFSGPHAYVSPSLYAESRNVPTWNFIAVHLYGRHRIINSFEEKKVILERSIQAFEAAWFEQWKSLDTGYRDRLINGMTGLEIEIDQVEAKYKLSQNRSEVSRQNVMEHFLSTGHELGDYMKNEKKKDLSQGA